MLTREILLERLERLSLQRIVPFRVLRLWILLLRLRALDASKQK